MPTGVLREENTTQTTATEEISMAGCRLSHHSGGRFALTLSAVLLLCLGRASAADATEYFAANSGVIAPTTATAIDAGCCDCGSYDCDYVDRCCPDCLSCCETITESIFGCPDPGCWYPLPCSTLFSDGWRQPWVPSPNGSGGAPRQGWINAADGNMYRLWFFTYAQGFNSPPQEDAYLGGYTLLTPLSRRLMLITNIPFVVHNNVSGGLPTVGPEGQPGATVSETTFGDVSFTPRVLLHETQDFSLTFDLTVLTPTGNEPLAGQTAVTVAFWYNLAGGWVVRGGVGDVIPTDGSGADTIVSQLAIGQTVTDHDVPLFGDFTYYVSAVANSPLDGGDSTSVTLTPGMRTHLGCDWYFLAGMPTPVTERRVADLGMILWIMKAW
jgi:hypothetical protein